MGKEASLMPIKIGILYSASIIGAGFASGKEIVLFFTHFESASILGIIIAGVFISIFGYIVMSTSREHNISSVGEFLELFFGKMAVMIEFVIATFVFVVFSVMLAGSGQIIASLTAFPGMGNVGAPVYSLLVLLLAYFCSINGGEFIAKIAVGVMSLLFCGILCFSIYVLFSLKGNIAVCSFVIGTVSVGSLVKIIPSIFCEAIGYCGYNGMLSLGTLIDISRKKPSYLQIVTGTIFAGGIFITLATIINCVMRNYQLFWLEKLDFPLVDAIGTININVGSAYKVIILLAMFLSIIINGFFLLKRNSLLPLFAYIFVFVGFSKIIGIFYPIFGFLGIILIIFLIIRYFMIK